MKVILTTAAFVLALTGAMDAAADHKRGKHSANDRGRDTYTEHRSHKHGGRHYRQRGMRLHLPVRIDGSDRIRLDRLVYRHHGDRPRPLSVEEGRRPQPSCLSRLTGCRESR